jgi:hypothetical protein
MIRDEVLMIDLGTIDLLFLLIIEFHALAHSTVVPYDFMTAMHYIRLLRNSACWCCRVVTIDGPLSVWGLVRHGGIVDPPSFGSTGCHTLSCHVHDSIGGRFIVACRKSILTITCLYHHPYPCYSILPSIIANKVK